VEESPPDEPGTPASPGSAVSRVVWRTDGEATDDTRVPKPPAGGSRGQSVLRLEDSPSSTRGPTCCSFAVFSAPPPSLDVYGTTPVPQSPCPLDSQEIGHLQIRTEGGGFEPPSEEDPRNGFRDRRIRPPTGQASRTDLPDRPPPGNRTGGWAWQRRERDLNPRGERSRLRAFQARSFDRSDTSPRRCIVPHHRTRQSQMRKGRRSCSDHRSGWAVSARRSAAAHSGSNCFPASSSISRIASSGGRPAR
jgi:hypothetical protein